MRCTFDNRLKHIAAASLFSCFIAGAITGLTSPVSADNTASVTISVNRTFKANRLPIAPIEPAHTARLSASLQPSHRLRHEHIYSHTARLDTHRDIWNASTRNPSAQ